MRNPVARNTIAVAAVTAGAVSHHFHIIQKWIWTYWTAEGVTKANLNWLSKMYPCILPAGVKFYNSSALLWKQNLE